MKSNRRNKLAFSKYSNSEHGTVILKFFDRYCSFMPRFQKKPENPDKNPDPDLLWTIFVKYIFFLKWLFAQKSTLVVHFCVVLSFHEMSLIPSLKSCDVYLKFYRKNFIIIPISDVRLVSKGRYDRFPGTKWIFKAFFQISLTTLTGFWRFLTHPPPVRRQVYCI